MEVTGLDHANIVARDIDRTVAFYREVLGLGERTTPAMPPGYVVRWLTDTAGHPIFHVQQYDAARHAPEVLGAMTGAIDHIALECSDFDGMVARCKALGLAYRTNEMDGRDFRQLFLTDPNGIVLELNFRG